MFVNKNDLNRHSKHIVYNLYLKNIFYEFHDKESIL